MDLEGNFANEIRLKIRVFFLFFVSRYSYSLSSSFLFVDDKPLDSKGHRTGESKTWKSTWSYHFSALRVAAVREYLRAIFRHSRTQLCKQVFRQCCVLRKVQWRPCSFCVSFFHDFGRKKERKKVCHSGTFEFSLLILYIVTTRRILRLRLRCRLYYLTKFLTLHERTCAKVFESMKIFNRQDYYSLKPMFQNRT